jgi:hypothetical protein
VVPAVRPVRLRLTAAPLVEGLIALELTVAQFAEFDNNPAVVVDDKE